MLFTCIKIFLARIVDVSLGTIRTVLVVKGNRFTSAIIAFFEVLIWFIVAREALNTDLDSWLIPVFYSAGYAAGTYIGGFISNNYLERLISVSIITKSRLGTKMIKEIRKSGFGVSVLELKNPEDEINKKMLIVQLNKSKLKKLTKIIRSIDPDAFVVINETKYVQNGIK